MLNDVFVLRILLLATLCTPAYKDMCGTVLEQCEKRKGIATAIYVREPKRAKLDRLIGKRFSLLPIRATLSYRGRL